MGDTLTNMDIVRMVKAGIAENVILHVIQVSETNFVTSANALIELKKQRVPDRVLDAMLDSGSGAHGRQMESLSVPMVVEPSAVQHHHQLPTFDAAVRLDSKTTAKVSVGKNTIKVEQSGVPLFSLKWKEPRSQ
jgi:hypothetical protein